ncbi:MAG TPA: hypothetical protein VM427_03340 [Patescibacteria group bacterium]|nr:hypothetical protein [Patescibacteria group bacterium]
MTATVRASRSVPRSLLILLSAVLAASGIVLATARPAGACSCARFTSMRDGANADSAVFSGTAGVRDRRGVPVSIDRWFWGRGAAPIVWLAASSFGDGAACGTNPPPAGSSWIWVTWFPPDAADPATGLCSPSGDLSTGDGQKMLAEAIQAFPALVPLETLEPTAIPAGPATPAVTAAPDSAAVARDQAGVAIGAGLIAVVAILFGGLTLLARRLDRNDPDRA